jgi:hypothetical protein
MNDPLTKLDPEKLKRERADVDLGASEETEHLRHEDVAESSVVPGSDNPVHQPTSGVTPPAR